MVGSALISVILYVVGIIVTGGSAVWVLMTDPAAREDAAMWTLMPIAWLLICWPFTGAADGRSGAGGESDAAACQATSGGKWRPDARAVGPAHRRLR